jgi:pectate lyase
MMNKKILPALSALVLAVMACSFNTAKTPTAQAPSGAQVLFQDDFSNPDSGWDRAQSDFGSTDYSNGSYVINIAKANIYIFANPSQSFQNDVRIEVDAVKASGTVDNAYGVLCRYQDPDNYYFFEISSDGYVGIGINKAGVKTLLSSSDNNMVPDSSINQGDASNHLRVDCIGSTLTLYVNGTQAASATDSSFTGGDTGLIAETFTVAGTEIQFDNLFVYKP